MAPRKNAKGGGGNSSSSGSGSGSGSGSPSTGSSGSSSSPGARRGQSPRRPGPGCGREPGGRCRSGLILRPPLLSILSEAPVCAGRGRAHRAGRRRSRVGRRGTPSTSLPEHWPALSCLSWWKLGVEGPLSFCSFRGAWPWAKVRESKFQPGQQRWGAAWRSVFKGRDETWCFVLANYFKEFCLVFLICIAFAF